MSLTTKQREALQALADVMQEHDISINVIFSLGEFNLQLQDTFFELDGIGYFDVDSIKELLQEQE